MIYTWHQQQRHPIQWMPMLFGVGMILQALGFIGVTAFSNENLSAWWIGVLILAVFGTAGACLFWCGYRKRAVETLELRETQMVFDNGPTILPAPLMWFVAFPFQLHPFFSHHYANPAPHFRRRVWTVPRESVLLVLERVGERQRLRFDVGRDRVEMGVWLTEPEREWLAMELEKWQRRTSPCESAMTQ